MTKFAKSAEEETAVFRLYTNGETSNHYELFGSDMRQPNRVVNFCTNGKHFYALAVDKPSDFHFTGDGERVSNITQWGIDHINGHYRQEWGDDFKAQAGEDGITAEEIFAYTYAVLHKSRGTITLDERTTLAGVPEKAWEYRLGSRSALEWVLDQYKERKPRDPTIREKFNNYRFSDHKERVIDLLRRVCTVSAATMEIVDSMAQHEALGR